MSEDATARRPATEAARPTAREETPIAPEIPPIVFVGGTGRSGTHVVAALLSRHVKLRLIPVECRFHVEERGFPGLLAGTVSKRAFMRRMRGFWWRGFQTNRLRGLHRFVPRERFDSALASFDQRFDDDPEGACRALFYDLLWFRAEQRRAAIGIVEQSCDVVAEAPTLVRLFGEAKFIHVVRDGRDASASRVAQLRWLTYPRTREQGLEWWESRIRAIDAGARVIPEGRLLEVSLEDLLSGNVRGALRPVAAYLGLHMGDEMRRYFHDQMSHELANTGRWRQGISEEKRRLIARRYEEILDRFEADGVTCAPLLRASWERSRAEGGDG